MLVGMKQHGTFPIVLQKEKEGGYSVTNLALEGCYSQGETIDEALENIQEAIQLCLEDLPEKKKLAAQKQQISLHLVPV